MFTFRKITVVMVAAVLLLTACGGQSASDSGEVKITLTDFGIESSVTEFKAGVPYRFVVTNEGLVEHEFMLMPPFRSALLGTSLRGGIARWILRNQRLFIPRRLPRPQPGAWLRHLLVQL